MPPGLSLVLVAFAWGLAFVLTPRALSQTGLGLFLLVRFMCAYLVISLVFRKQMRSVSFRAVTRGIILGGALYGTALCQALAVLRGGGEAVVVTLALAGLAVPVFAFALWRRRPSRIEALAVVLSAGGAWLMGSAITPLAAAAALFLALYVALGAAFVQECAPEHLAGTQLACATLCALLGLGRDLPVQVDLTAWALVLSTALIATAWGALAVMRALRCLSATRTGVILGLQALTALAVLARAGRLALEGGLALGFVLLGLGALVALYPQSEKERN